MKYGLVLVLIGMALAGRLLPHPDNFTPVLAVALFGGAMLPGRLGLLLPVAGLFLSDLALGYPFTGMTAVIYASFVAAAGIGRWLGARRTWPRTALSAAGGSLLFYAATNFAVWALPGAHAPLYAPTLDGLLECYAMALPFLRNSLAGDLFWTVVLFGAFDLARSRLGTSRATPARSA
jgi:uncharacterized protein DUF6580